MTPKEKELLLEDIYARLPYGLFVHENREQMDDQPVIYTYDYHPYIDNCLPYLRSLSSMTEKESKEYRMFIDYSYNDFTSESTPCVYVDKIKNYINWLNSHHFDYRELIPMGLALEAPEGMYK